MAAYYHFTTQRCEDFRSEKNARKLFAPSIRLVCDLVPLFHLIELTTTGIEVDLNRQHKREFCGSSADAHLIKRYDLGFLDNLPASPTDPEDRQGDVGREEGTGIPHALQDDREAIWRMNSVESIPRFPQILTDDNDNGEEEEAIER